MAYIVYVHATFDSLADAQHIFNQSQSVAVNASVANIGQPSERTSHATVVEVLPEGHQVLNHWHIDLFGIVRSGQVDANDPPAWIQPLGAQDAYPATNVRGEPSLVSHNEKQWQNAHGNGNIWEPGVFGWTDVTPPPEPPPISEWAVGVAYVVDDEVIYQGLTYRCLQPHTSQVGWEPPNVPALWSLV